jgi:hypothetical protein
MEVVNHKTGDKCYMKFEPYSYFGGTPKKVTGTVNSVDDKVYFFSFFLFFSGGGRSRGVHGFVAWFLSFVRRIKTI